MCQNLQVMLTVTTRMISRSGWFFRCREDQKIAWQQHTNYGCPLMYTSFWNWWPPDRLQCLNSWLYGYVPSMDSVWNYFVAPTDSSATSRIWKENVHHVVIWFTSKNQTSSREKHDCYKTDTSADDKWRRRRNGVFSTEHIIRLCYRVGSRHTSSTGKVFVH